MKSATLSEASATIQVRDNTRYDRYPAVFRAVTRQLRNSRPSGGLNVLSFGCSSGEEAFSLADKYLTLDDDRILGVDISEKQIQIAREQNNSYPRVQFSLSTPEVISKRAPFDAILALSVLCVWPGTKGKESIASIFPFQRFESICRELTGYLRKGGLLAIYNSNFCFKDAGMYSRYRPVEVPGLAESGFVRKFDKENRAYSEDYIYREVLFEKLG